MGKGTSNAHGWRALALTVILAAAAFGSSACKTYSSREASDPSRSVARLQAGGTVQAEVDRLAEPLIHSGKAYGLAVGVLGPGGLALTGGYGRTGRAPLAVIVLYNNFLWRDKVGHNLILRLANGLNAPSAKPPSELRQAAGQTNDPLNETQAADQREAGGALAGAKSH